MKGLLTFHDGSISEEQIAIFKAQFLMPLDVSNAVRIQCYDQLNRYPWIRDIAHLQRVNKYRKRVRQSLLVFNSDDMAELALMDRSRNCD